MEASKPLGVAWNRLKVPGRPSACQAACPVKTASPARPLAKRPAGSRPAAAPARDESPFRGIYSPFFPGVPGKCPIGFHSGSAGARHCCLHLR